MSKHIEERWRCRDTHIVAGEGEGFTVAEVYQCTLKVGERQELQSRIVADHNACLGIEDPGTTVPELVAMCRQLRLALEDAAPCKGDFLRHKYRDETLIADTDDLLAKTGQRAS